MTLQELFDISKADVYVSVSNGSWMKLVDNADVVSVDKISGVLPVSKGGTGATSASAARSALGVTPSNIGAAPSSPVLLWSGTWSSGSIKINNISKYKLFIVSIDGSDDRLVGVTTGDTICLFCVAVWNTGLSYMAQTAARLTRSTGSDTISLNASGRINSSNGYSYGFGNIKQIYAVV